MCDLARMISVLHYCVGVKQAVKQVVLRPKHCGLRVERRGSCVCMNDGDYIAVCLSLNLVEWHRLDEIAESCQPSAGTKIISNTAVVIVSITRASCEISA